MEDRRNIIYIQERKQKTCGDQEDLDALYKWSEKWQLRFHPDKCKVLSLGNRPPEYKPKFHLYIREDNGTLREAPLEETSSEKDIGVIIDNKLSFREQIHTKTSKANTTMGIIRRTLRITWTSKPSCCCTGAWSDRTWKCPTPYGYHTRNRTSRPWNRFRKGQLNISQASKIYRTSNALDY